ncbi:MAG: aminotransferase class I/II-fold pyridoxal phosphate-dependent enzyme, partial [Bacteroidales bacterium]|nr:aminotransferase class I/II-fold pyridoxal phosphate-dependent enzyme [Bacteroidales bacterium]
TINYMKHAVRPYIFTASISPASTASVLAALHIIRTEPERQAALWDIQRYAIKSFSDLGFEIGNTSTPIIPLYVRDNEKTFAATRMLLDAGVFISPVVAPAVRDDETLVRVALMATHTKEQIDFGVEQIYKTFKQLEIL